MNVVWTEIPVKEMQRAIDFYSAVFELEIKIDISGPPPMAFIPFTKDSMGSSAALVHNPEYYHPSDLHGPLVYFHCSDIEVAEKRIEANGGKVLISKHTISQEHGSMGVFLDSEGNRIALHTP